MKCLGGRSTGQRGIVPRNKKKTAEKALIPLPPTGLACFFYANPKVMQTHMQHRQAVGLPGVKGIAQSANLRKGMKRIRTAALWPTESVEHSEMPSR